MNFGEHNVILFSMYSLVIVNKDVKLVDTTLMFIMFNRSVESVY